jgi:hypothetical protein
LDARSSHLYNGVTTFNARETIMTPPDASTAQTSPASAPAKAGKPTFSWEDPLLLDDQLTEDERMVRDTARRCSTARS